MNYFINNQVVSEARHQFIYRKPSFECSYRFMNVQINYPVFVDRTSPMVVYVENYTLPNVENKMGKDSVVVNRIATEYLNFSIASSIIKNFLENVDRSLYKKRESKFLEKINRLFINNKEDQVSSVGELYAVFLQMQQFYYTAYINYLNTGKLEGTVFDLPIAFLPIDHFVKMFKNLLNSETYFAIIFDTKKGVPDVTQQSINNLMGSRINKDISVKVLCERDTWNNYYDMQGNLIEFVHDVGTVTYPEEDEYTRIRR